MSLTQHDQDTQTEERPHDPHSVGIVKLQTAFFDETLILSSGSELKHFTLAYETYGRLNTERTNAILICHALSGDAHVAGYYTENPEEKPGWWDDAVGPGKTVRHGQVFCGMQQCTWWMYGQHGTGHHCTRRTANPTGCASRW